MTSFFTDFYEARESYFNAGYFIEESLLDEKTCQDLISESHDFETAKDQSFLPVFNIHKKYSLFGRLISNPKIIAPLCSILNGEPYILQTQFYFTPPNRNGLLVHQDNYYIEAENENFLSIWIPLVDTNKNNGGLYTFKGLHKNGIYPVESIYLNLDNQEKKQTLAEQTKLPENEKSIDLSVKKGSVVFLHGCNPHGSYQNNSDTNRPVILCTYIKKGSHYRKGNTANRHATPVM